MKPNITITVRYILYILITPQRHPFSLMIHPSFTSSEATTELFPVIIDQCAFSKIISLPLSYTHSVFCVASFNQHDYFEIHLFCCMYQQFFFLFIHSMAIPQFVYPFSC